MDCANRILVETNVDQDLTDFYTQSVGEQNKMNTVTINAKIGKSIIPAWAYKSWKEKYKIKY